ncbi:MULTISPECIES: hypothetical protein [Rhodobacterales]|uniref:hypothetical protein n=1 Tax=Rhodobacterales TaxID=204455 RepID=UPI003736E70F
MKFFAPLVLAVALSGCLQMTPITESKPVRLSNAQIRQIQETVTVGFFDPEAARFRKVRAVDVVLQDGQRERRVCGEVNGKNRLGGYVGYEFFGGSMINGKFLKKDFFGACEAW